MGTPFREAEHPRASSGEFTAKTNSDPESQLMATEPHPVPPAVMQLMPTVSGTTQTDPDSGQTLFTTSHAELQEVLAAAYAAGKAAQPPAVGVMRGGEFFEGSGVTVIDLSFLGREHTGEYDQGDIDGIVEQLQNAGFDEAANDVQEWWAAGE